MKRITLFMAFLLGVVSWQTNAQAVSDNFDSYTVGADATGWTKYQTETDDPGFIVTDIQANSGTNSLYHNDDNIAAVSTSWVVAPVYTATGNDLLEFYYQQNYTPSYYDYSGVWFSTTGSDPIANPGDWTEIAEFNDTDQPYSEDAWTQYLHIFTEAAGTSIYIAFKYTGVFAHEFYIDDFKIDVTPQYMNPTFALTAVPDCANNQFSVDVEVTDLGGSSSVTVSDDQGSATQQLSATGTVTFGPYADATNVTFTVTSDDDNTVSASDSVANYCPAANDDCTNAAALTVYDSGAGAGNETTIHSAAYTDSGVHPTCDDYGTNIDMWYTFTVPAGETELRAIYTGDKATSVESALWDSCGGAELACNDSSSNAYQVFTGLTAGQTYYLQLWVDDFNAGTFDVVLEKMPPAPNCADNPTPADASTVQFTTEAIVVLSWDPPTSGPTPDSYFVELGTTSGTYTISGTITAPPVNLTNVPENTTYYWRVTPNNGGTPATGCTEWSFTTGAYPTIANDDCSGAISLTVSPNTCTSPISVHNSFTNDSGVAAPSCGNYQASSGNGDLWYAVTIPTGITEITLDVSNVTGLTSVAGAFYSGDCTNLTEVECWGFHTGWGGWPHTFSNLIGGDTYYFRVWDYSNDQLGTFDLCAYYSPVSISDNQIEGFKFYPNPVNNVLNMSAQDNITAVSISNITGQEVMKLNPNSLDTQVNMSQLQNGIYFVKVQVNGQVTAFKVVKQ